MTPAIPQPIRLARLRQEKRQTLAGLRPGWLCPKCGGAHGPNVETCPQGRAPSRDIIR